MKAWIAVDEFSIVRCIATDKSNIHLDKQHMKQFHVWVKGQVGDKWREDGNVWTPQPDNYPKPSRLEIEQELGKLLNWKTTLEEIGKELKIDKTEDIDKIDIRIAELKSWYPSAQVI